MSQTQEGANRSEKAVSKTSRSVVTEVEARLQGKS